MFSMRSRPHETRTVSRHLQSCDRCAADYMEVAEAVSLLALITVEDLLE